MYLGPCDCVFHVLLREIDKQRKKKRNSWTPCMPVSSSSIVHAVHLNVSGHSDTARSLPLGIMSELKDCPPLKYYDFKPVEHVKVCPRYTAVLGRSEDDGIGIEELDTLQLELETLLSSASRRLRALEEQRQVETSKPFFFFNIIHILQETPLITSPPLLDAISNFSFVLHLRSSQTGKIRRGTSAF